MRRIVNVTNVSLDGVMERMEDWHFEYAGAPEMEELTWRLLEPCDTLVLGRRTYDGFAEAWPGRPGRVAERLNTMRKVVVSTTATAPTWENTGVLADDVATGLAALKAEDGGDVMTYGFGPVARTLVEHGLLDELHVLVNPVLAGRGRLEEMLIRDGTEARLGLTEARPVGAGVALLSYRPLPRSR